MRCVPSVERSGGEVLPVLGAQTPGNQGHRETDRERYRRVDEDLFRVGGQDHHGAGHRNGCAHDP